MSAGSTLLIFAMSAEHPDQHFGGLSISNEFWSYATMPWACTSYIDARKPENCKVDFDAHLYDVERVRDFVDRYVRLLDAIALNPDVQVAQLLRDCA